MDTDRVQLEYNRQEKVGYRQHSEEERDPDRCFSLEFLSSSPAGGHRAQLMRAAVGDQSGTPLETPQSH